MSDEKLSYPHIKHGFNNTPSTQTYIMVFYVSYENFRRYFPYGNKTEIHLSEKDRILIMIKEE